MCVIEIFWVYVVFASLFTFGFIRGKGKDGLFSYIGAAIVSFIFGWVSFPATLGFIAYIATKRYADEEIENGKMAERSNASVLKTDIPKGIGGN